MNRAKAIEKYLRAWAEAESRVLAPPLASYRYVLCVVAYREDGSLLDRLESLLGRNQGVLIILVINRPTTPGTSTPASSDEPAEDSRPSAAELELAQQVRQRYTPLRADSVGQYFDLGDHSTLLAIDRYSRGRGIPASQGVGLARKIAADIACHFIHRGIVRSPWIHSSDADVRWPANYFAISEGAPTRASALLYPFRHETPPGDAGLAVQLYEFSLRYYVAGLRWSGSPYAMHTVGSTLAIHYIHYAMVRGFPKRSAGEDFYILNKLAKTGPVAALASARLRIAGRSSDRVPFGTGAARDKIMALARPLDDHRFYHPQCFSQLRMALEWMQRLAHADQPLAHWQKRLNERPQPAFVMQLQAMRLDGALQHASQQSRDPGHFSRHLTTWFDAFRTRVFVHGIRDRHHPSITLHQVLSQANFLSPLPAAEAMTLAEKCTRPGLALARINRRLLLSETPRDRATQYSLTRR